MSEALLYCTLLALQYGLQPILSSRFTTPSISKASIVIGTEIGKIIIAATSIGFGEKPGTLKGLLSNWSLIESLKVAFVPASMYAVQNLLVQHGYDYLDAMTFNVLNQLKTISAAFWLWVLMGQKQSKTQIFALILLMFAAIALNMSGDSSSGSIGRVGATPAEVQLGIVFVLVASLLSGLSAALTQKALVAAQGRHSLFYSAELALYGIIFLLVHALFAGTKDRHLIMSGHLFDNWNAAILIPVTANALGGLIVGLVTKYAGGVRKGFALIAGICLTAFVSWLLENKPMLTKDWFAIALVSLSIYLHSNYPIKKSITQSGSNSAINEDLKKGE